MENEKEPQEAQGEEGEQELIHDGGRRGRLFVVNYAEEMFANGGSRFRMALKAVRNQINDMCCLGDSGEMCAILFANISKSNEKAENIDNMFVYRDMGPMDAEFVKGLDALLRADDQQAILASTLGESGVCNWAELFYLCQKLLRYGHHFRKKFIQIFTTDEEKISSKIRDQVRNRLEEIQNAGIEVNVFLLDDPSATSHEEAEEPMENSAMSEFWTWVDPELSRYSNIEELETGLRWKNHALRSTTTLPFKMGDNFEFAVGLYYLISTQRKPQAIMMDSETGERVEQRVHFIPEGGGEGAEEENDAEEPLLPGMMKGERFEGEVGFKRDVGGVDVVLEREELEKLRRFDQPGITVIGFKPVALLKDSYRMGPARFIYPIDSVISGSSAVYGALLKRCLARKLFILVRYTHKTNTAPKLCALIPQSRDQTPVGCTLPGDYFYEGFHLVELPFAEKARSMQKRYQPPAAGIGTWPGASGEQTEAAKEFVRKLTVSTYSPHHFANPMLQQHYKAVEAVALDLEFDPDEFQQKAMENDQLKPYFKNAAFSQRAVVEAAKFKELCCSTEQGEGHGKGRKTTKGRGRKEKEVKKEEMEEEEEEQKEPEVPRKRGKKAGH